MPSLAWCSSARSSMARCSAGQCLQSHGGGGKGADSTLLPVILEYNTSKVKSNKYGWNMGHMIVSTQAWSFSIFNGCHQWQHFAPPPHIFFSSFLLVSCSDRKWGPFVFFLFLACQYSAYESYDCPSPQQKPKQTNNKTKNDHMMTPQFENPGAVTRGPLHKTFTVEKLTQVKSKNSG